MYAIFKQNNTIALPYDGLYNQFVGRYNILSEEFQKIGVADFEEISLLQRTR